MRHKYTDADVHALKPRCVAVTHHQTTVGLWIRYINPPTPHAASHIPQQAVTWKNDINLNMQLYVWSVMHESW